MKKNFYLDDIEDRTERNRFSVIADFEGNEEQLMNVDVNDIVPVLPLRNMVLFPGVFMPVSVGYFFLPLATKYAERGTPVL